jgi:hypothetical protein
MEGGAEQRQREGEREKESKRGAAGEEVEEDNDNEATIRGRNRSSASQLLGRTKLQLEAQSAVIDLPVRFSNLSIFLFDSRNFLQRPPIEIRSQAWSL